MSWIPEEVRYRYQSGKWGQRVSPPSEPLPETLEGWQALLAKRSGEQVAVVNEAAAKAVTQHEAVVGALQAILNLRPAFDQWAVVGAQVKKRLIGGPPGSTPPHFADPLGVGEHLGDSWGEAKPYLHGKDEYTPTSRYSGAWRICGWWSQPRTYHRGEASKDDIELWLSGEGIIFALHSGKGAFTLQYLDPVMCAPRSGFLREFASPMRDFEVAPVPLAQFTTKHLDAIFASASGLSARNTKAGLICQAVAARLFDPSR